MIFLILSRNNPKFTLDFLINNLTQFENPPKDMAEYLQWINTKKHEIKPYQNASLIVLDEIIYENDQEIIPHLPILIQHLVVYNLNVEILKETKEKLLSFLINSLGIRYSTNEETFNKSTNVLYENYMDPCTQLVLKENPKLKFLGTDSIEKVKKIKTITNLPLKNTQANLSIPDLDNLPDLDTQTLPLPDLTMPEIGQGLPLTETDLNIPLPEIEIEKESEIDIEIDEFDKIKYPFEHRINKISEILINFNKDFFDQWGQIAFNCAIKTPYQNIAINSFKAFYTIQQEYNPTLIKFLSAITISSLDQNVHIYKALIDIIEKIIKLKSNTFKGLDEWIILANLSSSLLFINQSEIFEKGLQFLNLIFQRNKLKKIQIANGMIEIWQYKIIDQDNLILEDPRNDKEINLTPEQIININQKVNEDVDQEEEEEEKESDDDNEGNEDEKSEDEDEDEKSKDKEKGKGKSEEGSSSVGDESDDEDSEDSDSEKKTKKKTKKTKKKKKKKKGKRNKKKEEPLPIITKTKPSEPKVLPLIQVDELPKIKLGGGIRPIDLQMIRTIFKGYSSENLIKPTFELVINLIESFGDQFKTGNNFLLSSMLLMLASKYLTMEPKEQNEANELLNKLHNLQLKVINKIITIFKRVFEFKDETQFLRQFFNAYSKIFSGKLQFSFGINSLLHLLKFSDTKKLLLKTIWFKMLIWHFANYGLIWSNPEFLHILNTCKYYGYSKDTHLSQVAHKCYSLLVVFANDIKSKDFSSFITHIPNIKRLRKSTKKFDNSQISVFLLDNIDEMKYKDQNHFTDSLKNLISFLMK
ncbi:hypothetical protein M0813_13718 [Anaeramoeba flamelloides]|uniref:Telomere length regulation protein conserved domain-containing protein n=1 Tax=Anaeramoeba flamelloides TaxID=1746091 RepID=A0ABQ8Z7J1_9EUKA|nr:hypothetical protein M0813_13718 [Anaeramoeba flamelloides]